MRKFRIVDLRGEVIAQLDSEVEAASPEAAVSVALGLDVVRGSSKRIPPVARVYWSDGSSQTNMVRLYERLPASDSRRSIEDLATLRSRNG